MADDSFLARTHHGEEILSDRDLHTTIATGRSRNRRVSERECGIVLHLALSTLE
jgi:hypothetical protein